MDSFPGESLLCYRLTQVAGNLLDNPFWFLSMNEKDRRRVLVILRTPSPDVVPDVLRITVAKISTDLSESDHLCKICSENR